MESYTVRAALPDDAPGLDACLEAAYAADAARLDDLPVMSGAGAEDIAKHDVWVAEAGGSVIGCLVLTPHREFMLLANVAVHPDARGLGLGRRLLRLAESETQNHGLSEMRLNTHAGMHDTISLYARNGWIKIGRDGNKVTMKKTVSGNP